MISTCGYAGINQQCFSWRKFYDNKVQVAGTGIWLGELKQKFNQILGMETMSLWWDGNEHCGLDQNDFHAYAAL